MTRGTAVADSISQFATIQKLHRFQRNGRTPDLVLRQPQGTPYPQHITQDRIEHLIARIANVFAIRPFGTHAQQADSAINRRVIRDVMCNRPRRTVQRLAALTSDALISDPATLAR